MGTSYLAGNLAELGGTISPKSLEICCASCPDYEPCGLKFQGGRTNGSRVIAVGSWAENIANFWLFYL